ncbi:SCO family protein [Alicyclobacillus cycloheptanicus]|uniref:Protein SCO1/2 n=1 Tax=Alicyclobacillus cycloheptanicus TaxID=1457 RepID=A0ABT9XN04_9BACL|nr:SCO family protein [Alicyclobacillus cycloheptanicus]MDQ0191510.1 protein SCO1/2 [Alicyclobacillus cycloheptanicus]WDL99986.1 SCO family protein [Alicyclobacillus cycloheptanicus]
MFSLRKRWLKFGFYGFTVILLIGIIGGITYMIRAGGGTLPVAGQATDFTATNVDGKPVSFNSLDGKIRLVTFFYTHCPGPCPLVAFRLEQIQNELQKEGVFGNKVAIVSVTLDPEHDTLPVLLKWADRYHPDFQGWYFVRPTPEQLPQILKAWGVQKQVVPGTVYISHTIKTELIDQNGNIRATYSGDNPNPQQVERDINSLLARWNWL